VKTIWKYPVPLPSLAHGAGGASLEVPAFAYLLHVGRDANEQACMWWQVDTDSPTNTPRRFDWIGTGNPVPENADYRGTVPDAPFVWHLYEVRS
jgi:hypothetical protein